MGAGGHRTSEALVLLKKSESEPPAAKMSQRNPSLLTETAAKKRFWFRQLPICTCKPAKGWKSTEPVKDPNSSYAFLRCHPVGHAHQCGTQAETRLLPCTHRRSNYVYVNRKSVRMSTQEQKSQTKTQDFRKTRGQLILRTHSAEARGPITERSLRKQPQRSLAKEESASHWSNVKL